MSCDAKRVRVYVDGQEIVTTDVQTTIEKDGPAAINRITEVHFPYVWDGVDQASKINAFNNSNSPQKGVVEFRSEEGKYVPLGGWKKMHTGIVTGAGGTGKSGIGKFWIHGYEQFVDGIPASKFFGIESTVKDVFDYILKEISENTIQSGKGEIKLSGGMEVMPRMRKYTKPEGEGTDFTNLGDVAQAIGTTAGIVTKYFNEVIDGDPLRAKVDALVKTNKTFRANRHTIKDVLEWISEITGADWHFGVDGSLQVELMGGVVHSDVRVNASNTNTVEVIENDAYSEMSPENTVRVVGDTKGQFKGNNVPDTSDTKYPVAEASYEPFVKRAGGKLTGTIVESKKRTHEAIAGEATKLLLEKIRSGQGDMEIYGKAPLEPYDAIQAPPVCNGRGQPTARALAYEVDSIHHRQKEGNAFRSRVVVSNYIDHNKINIETNTEQALGEEVRGGR